MKRIIFLLALFFGTVLPGFSAGLIIIHDTDFWRPPYWPHPPPIIRPPRPIPPAPVYAPVELNYTKVETRIKDQIAVTSVDQEFYNPNPRQLEGTFLFPVPKGAHIDKFTMEIGGKQVEAELLTADKARNIYEEIVRRQRDPALLEYVGRDLFKVRIFPIEANAKKRITLSYSQLLKSDAGLVNFLFPLNTEKFSAKPLKSVSVKIDLESKRALKSIYSPSHRVEVRRQGDHKATIGYEANDVKPDADFQLFFAQEEGEFGVSLLTYKAGEEDGYFLLLASPGVESKAKQVAPKDVAFVLDTSGSMAGAKLEQAKKALLFCVENLNDNDRFEIMRFATEVEPLFDKLDDATERNRSKAREFVKGLKPIGGTAIDEALKKALALHPEKTDRPYVIIFLTDGKPTVGVTDEDQIVGNLTKKSVGNTRVFCFGIGTDVNTHLLDKITEETKAFSQYVLPEEDIEVKVSGFFTKIKEPVLANTRLTYPDGLRTTKLYPSLLPDLFKGEQLVVVGRYSGKARDQVILEGTLSGETKKFSYDLNFPEQSSDHDFIPRLWATRRVGYLLDEIRLRGESKELKDEVTELARKYSIVTPYTAYLIVEDERRRDVAVNLQTLPALNFDAAASTEAAHFYRDLKLQKDGEAAVGGAQLSQTLKEAQSPASDISRQNAMMMRRRYGIAAPAADGGIGGNQTLAPANAPLGTLAVGKRIAQSTQENKFVNGRSFYLNANQWVDSLVQKAPNAKRVRLQFNSPEYFDFIAKESKALAWLALGKNVHFVLADTVYEIYE